MYTGYVSAVNIDTVGNTFGQGLQQLEGDLNEMVEKLSNDPNPNQGDLLKMQIFASKYQAMVQSMTQITKTLADMLKAVATNIGT
ncbi:MAG: EscF/YscF/HrpA family type III secretion system needle major subunit [Bdellovibrionota bacterium]